MSQSDLSIVYRDLGVGGLPDTQALWERQRDFHVALSTRFSDDIRQKTFATRCDELRAKAAAGGLCVDVAYLEPDRKAVGYCITSRSDTVGEIESLYIVDEFRGHGIGTALMRRALAWLDEHHIARRHVALVVENDAALQFYRRFGFHSRVIIMQQIPDED